MGWAPPEWEAVLVLVIVVTGLESFVDVEVSDSPLPDNGVGAGGATVT